jgi:hypothetical protein
VAVNGKFIVAKQCFTTVKAHGLPAQFVTKLLFAKGLTALAPTRFSRDAVDFTGGFVP